MYDAQALADMKRAIHYIYPGWDLSNKPDNQICAIYYRVREKHLSKPSVRPDISPEEFHQLTLSEVFGKRM